MVANQAAKVAKQPARPTPELVMRHYWGIASTQALVTAIELDVFSLIANGKHTVQAISRAAKTTTRGMTVLLDALVGMQLLTKGELGYELTPDSEMYLVDSSLVSFGRMIRQGGRVALKSWSNLTEVVRTGKPLFSADEKHFEKFFPELVRALFPLSYSTALAFCAALPEQERDGIKDVLDVAAGSGAWSLPFARFNNEAVVTAIDFPQVLEVTREYAERLGVADQYRLKPGNIRETHFGADEFDLVILGNICHSEGERSSKALVKKCYKALRKGGQLLIADVIPNDERTGPLMPLMFALNMLLNTTKGGVFTLSQFGGWMRRAGFSSVRAVYAGNESPLILGTK